VRIAVLAMLLCACTTISQERLPGWPVLQVIEHRVPHAEMRERCARYAGRGNTPEACVIFDFENALCHVWLSADFPPPPLVVRHERMHCEGYDHPGGTRMQAILERWLGRGRGTQ
jgi:hypothetical protein